jgi:ribosome-associated protein
VPELLEETTPIPRAPRSTAPGLSKAAKPKTAPSKAAKPKAAAPKTVRSKAAAGAKPARPKPARSKPLRPKIATPEVAATTAAAPTAVVLKPARSKPKLKLSAAARLAALAETLLDDGKAEEIATVDLQGKSDIADFMVIATGNSARQVAALAQRLVEGFKAAGHRKVSVEGLRQGEWVLLDAGDVIVHLFRPETRTYYNLEKMWGEALAEAAGQ